MAGDIGSSQSGAAVIPHSVFDTRGLAPKEAVSAWQESIGVMFDSRLREVNDCFFAHVEAFQIGDLFLATSAMAAQSFDRSSFRIGRDGLDHFLIQFYTQGSCGQRDGGPETRTRPGDLWVVDLTQAQASGISDCDSLNLIVPRRLLAPLLTRPDEHNLRVVPQDNLMVGLLHTHMRSLFEAGSRMSPEQASALVRPTVELVAAVLNGAVADETAGGVNTSLFKAIAGHVRDRLNDPTLSAETVAGHFGISTRKLYYLFQEQDGFATYVQKERLHACRRLLADPAHRGRSIAEIAESLCCGHPKSFSRAFRREIGMTAREVRQLALERHHAFALYAEGDQWWNWIGRMR